MEGYHEAGSNGYCEFMENIKSLMKFIARQMDIFELHAEDDKN